MLTALPDEARVFLCHDYKAAGRDEFAWETTIGVTAFGLTTAFNYALDGWVDWPLAAVFIGGGVLGGLLGARLAKALSGQKGVLNTVFAALIFVVAFYMLYRSAGALGLIG